MPCNGVAVMTAKVNDTIVVLQDAEQQVIDMLQEQIASMIRGVYPGTTVHNFARSSYSFTGPIIQGMVGDHVVTIHLENGQIEVENIKYDVLDKQAASELANEIGRLVTSAVDSFTGKLYQQVVKALLGKVGTITNQTTDQNGTIVLDMELS